VAPPDEGVVISPEEWRGGSGEQRDGTTESVLGPGSVDREVVPLATNPVPRYPAELRAARIEGTVQARFVVDTTGRVIMGSVILDASEDPAFGHAVIEALRRSRYEPAQLRGRKVRQLVSQSFLFQLRN
jgi:TonB family protein